MSVVVLGSSGQLARHLRAVLPGALFWGRDTHDMNELAALESALIEAAPRAIVNAAAYTAVDRAESEPAAAWRLNAEAPAAAARAAEHTGASLVHISTDYVFDGRATEPYAADAPVNPLNCYGASKLGGELAVRSLCRRHWILRTSWVFSEFGQNFVKTVLRLAAAGGPLRIVADQFGQPTYAGDLAALIGALVRTTGAAAAPPKVGFGVYHATGGPAVSWHAFAEHIVAKAVTQGLLPAPVTIKPITTADYPTAAARPAHGVLAPSAELLAGCGADFNWLERLDQALAEIQDNKMAWTQ